MCGYLKSNTLGPRITMRFIAFSSTVNIRDSLFEPLKYIEGTLKN